MKNIDLMVLAPHEDDELAIAGPMLYQAAQDGMKVKVVFTTNGDFYPHEGPIRINEAINALKVLGIAKEDIIFLGYGDQTQSIHLYNSPGDEVVCSYNGNDTTYGTSCVMEFAFQEYGTHHKYTRKNYKNDIKAVIKKYHPRMIITTDWDNHMDHLALSLMLDEVLGEIFREENNYHPLVLKGLAYNGKWEGYEDYHSRINVTQNVNLACGVADVHPLNKWEDRIRFVVPKACRTELLRDNILYKAAREHKSQNVDLKANQFINQDVVFWRRPTESLLYNAKIETSSGESRFLNDFKCFDCSDIVNDFRNYDESIWITDEEDSEKRIDIELCNAEMLSEIHFFENPAKCCRIENIQIIFDNGKIIDSGELQHDGSRTVISLPQMPLVKHLTIVIEKWTGQQIGLTELEVYGKKLELSDYVVPLKLWTEDVNVENKRSWKAKLEEKYIRFVKYARGRIWPDKYFLMKRYESLHVSDSVMKVWIMYLKFVAEKVLEKVK